MTKAPLQVIPVQAPVQEDIFDLHKIMLQAINDAGAELQDGDIIAISSKYIAISEGRVVDLDTVEVSEKAQDIAQRYNMNEKIAQLVVDESDHIFGGIQLGFLLTHRQGVISPNAGLDRSNIPRGKVVLLPADAYVSARKIRQDMRESLGVDIGVLVTDSWLMPGRWGTTGVAVGVAGFHPIQDERGKEDLFGNPMSVTQVGIADSICVCAQMVMGERDEATPIAIVRNSGVEIVDVELSVSDVSIPWDMCIYVESLTLGLMEGGAPDPKKERELQLNGATGG